MVLDDGTWVTVSEAARRLGITRAAVRKRIARGTVVFMSDNHGRPLVRVTGTVHTGTVPTVHTGTVRSDSAVPDGTARTVPCGTTHKVPGAGDAVPMVPATMIADAIARADAESARRLAERDAQHREAMAMMMERVDAAELRAERVEQRLDQVLDRLLERQDRPWWSRWFGQSKRSDL